MKERPESQRSLPASTGSGRQRKNMLRAYCTATGNAPIGTFNAITMTGGVHGIEIGDTINVKNSLGGQYVFPGEPVIVWAYDDGTYELIKKFEGYPQIAQFAYDRRTITADAVDELIVNSDYWLTSELFGAPGLNQISGRLEGVKLLLPGLYTIIIPFACTETGYEENSFTITDDGATARTFRSYATSLIRSTIGVVDNAETDLFGNLFKLSQMYWAEDSQLHINFSQGPARKLSICHTASFYLPADTIINAVGSIELVHFVTVENIASTDVEVYPNQGTDSQDQIYGQVLYWGNNYNPGRFLGTSSIPSNGACLDQTGIVDPTNPSNLLNGPVFGNIICFNNAGPGPLPGRN